MSWNEIKKNSTQIPLPNRQAAVRRVLIIALVLFPCTWIVTAFLIRSWNLLGDRNAESYRHLREAAVAYVAGVCIVFLLSLLPRPQRFLAWVTSWRIMRRCLITLAWIITIIALFYGEEDWRGRRAWNNYRNELVAQGVPVDFKTFIPKAVPDSENFAANPEVQSWFIRNPNLAHPAFSNALDGDNFALASPMVDFSDISKGPSRLTDLAAWKKAFAAAQAGRTKETPDFKSGQLDAQSRAEAAPAVLEALKPIDSRLETLRAASSRPESCYPVVYDLKNPWGILLPHLADIKAVSLRLDLKACAELAAGQSDRALEDVKLNLRLGDSLTAEPFLISYLVRAAALQLAAHSIWEGLAEDKWSDAQLKELQTLLARYDFIADMKPPFDSERTASILTADLLAAGRFSLNDLTGNTRSGGAAAATAFGRIMPRGWYEMEKLNYCRLYLLQLDGAFDVRAKRVFPENVSAGSLAVNRALAGRNPVNTIVIRHQLLSAILLPALGNIPKKGAAAQTTAEEAMLACALERYRVAHGQFPDHLDALAPELISALPHDVINGEPYKYRRTADSFVLYSVGWNETDDGGKVVTKGQALDQGDWVWQYPAK